MILTSSNTLENIEIKTYFQVFAMLLVEQHPGMKKKLKKRAISP